MKLPRVKKEVTHLPNIYLHEGRYLLDVGLATWKRLWEQVYKYEIVHWEERGGKMRICLDDAIKAVFPALKDDHATRSIMAAQFMWKLREERQRKRQRVRDARLRKEQMGEA